MASSENWMATKMCLHLKQTNKQANQKNYWATRISWIDVDPTSWSPQVLRGLVANMGREALCAGVQSCVPFLLSSHICVSCIAPFLSIHLLGYEWDQNGDFFFNLPWGQMLFFPPSLSLSWGKPDIIMNDMGAVFLSSNWHHQKVIMVSYVINFL